MVLPAASGLSVVAPLTVRCRRQWLAALCSLGIGLLPLAGAGDVAELQGRAQRGDPEALNALGNAYANGEGVPVDVAAALRHYQAAAEHGLPAASYNLGLMYELGRGVTQDAGQAFAHYRRAAEQGFAPAQAQLGLMFATGVGVAVDAAQAKQWYQRAASAGLVEAQAALPILDGETDVTSTAAQAALHRALLAVKRFSSENARLEDEVRRSTLELAALHRQVRDARAQLAAQGSARAEAAPERGRVDQEVAALRAQLEEEVSNRNQLAGELAAAWQTAQDAEQALATTRTRLAEIEAARPTAGAGDAAAADAKVAELTQNLRTVRADLAAALARVSAADTAAAHAIRTRDQTAGQLSSLRGALATAERELATLREQTAGAGVSAEQLAAEQAARAELEGRVKVLETQLAAARQQADQGGQQALTDLAAVRDRLVQAERAAEQLRADKETLIQELAQRPVDTGREAELEQLRRALTDTQAELAKKENLFTQAFQARQSAQQAHDDAVQEVRRLREVVDAAQRAPGAGKLREELAQMQAVLDTNERTIAELTGENDRLEQDLEVAKQSAAAALAAGARAASQAGGQDAMRMEIATLQDQVRTLENLVESERAGAAREFATLAQQLQRVRETNLALTEANRALLATREGVERDGQSRLAALEQRATGAEQMRDQLQRKNGELEQALAAARATPSAPPDWERERTSLRTQLGDLFGQLQAVEQQLAVAQNDSRSARGELAAWQGRAAENERAVDEQQASVAELTGLNQRLTEQQAGLERRVAELTGQVEQLRVDNRQLVATQETARRSQGEAERRWQEQLTVLSQENAALAQRLEEARAGLSARVVEAGREWERERQTLVNRLAGAENELATVQAERSSAGAAAEQARTEAMALRAQLADASNRLAQLDGLRGQLASTQRELAQQRSAQAQLQQESETRQVQVLSLQRENAAIVARLRQAQGTLDQIAAAARTATPAAPAATVTPAALPVINPAATTPERVHTVVEGDSLTRISLRYYGTALRWQDIYDANRALLAEANALRPGQRLRIP